MIDFCGAELSCVEKRVCHAFSGSTLLLVHVSHIHNVRWKETHEGSAIQVAYGASWSRLVLPSVRSNLHAACDICVYIQASDNVCKEHARMLLYWGCCHILGLLLSMHLIAFTITIYVLCCSGLRARTSPLLCVAVYSGCETMASVTMYLVLFTSMQVVTCMQRSTQIFINLLQNIYLF